MESPQRSHCSLDAASLLDTCLPLLYGNSTWHPGEENVASWIFPIQISSFPKWRVLTTRISIPSWIDAHILDMLKCSLQWPNVLFTPVEEMWFLFFPLQPLRQPETDSATVNSGKTLSTLSTWVAPIFYYFIFPHTAADSGCLSGMGGEN